MVAEMLQEDNYELLFIKIVFSGEDLQMLGEKRSLKLRFFFRILKNN